MPKLKPQTTTQLEELKPRLLPLQDAAKYLGAHLHFVRDLIWSKELPYLKFGKRYVVEVRDLDEYIERMKRAA